MCGPIKDYPEERRCYFLASVLHERCRIRLREELGAAYSPAASFNSVTGFPHLAHFVVYAEVPPARVQQAMQIIQREAQSLVTRGVSADEFARLKPPFLRERDDNLRQLDYWGRTVLAAAQAEPEHLTAARNRAADTAAITAAEVSALAKRFLDPARSLKFLTVPVAVPPQGATAPASGSTPAADKAGQPP
jgi:zinc protease